METSEIINDNIVNDNIVDDNTGQDYNDEYINELIDEFIIGIDLGTTNTCVGIWRNETLEIIPDEYGNRTIPSYVAYTNVNRYIGLDAKNQKDLNPANVFFEVKRLIGRKYDDPLISKEKELISYKIDKGEIGNIVLVSELNNNKVFSPEEISAAILSKAKYMATEYLKKKITKCVITIPAYFNDGQRQATKDAALIAGLDCIKIINEPTAAALAYGLLKRTCVRDQNETSKNIIVYDFGGGTLDVSLMHIENGIFEVMASSGNMRMGGSNFDNRLMRFCISKFEKQNNIQEIGEVNSMSLQKLRTACEQAKKILSTTMQTHIAVKNFHNNIDMFIQIDRKNFEKLCEDLFLICLHPIDEVLKQCSMNVEDVDEIILVGGMTRMPKIRDLIKLRFGKDANCTINPEEAVAAGAAIQGYLYSHQTDPFSESVTLLDTTALSLGVETIGGVMDPLIERGSIIPTSESKTYTTDDDYVTSVMIKIFEGERTLTKDNFFAGEFELVGIEPLPRGNPKIKVTFEIDKNGIIIVTAENEKSKEKSSVSVTSNKGRLTKEQITELIEEAKELEIRDQLEKRKKWLHYEIDDYCSNVLINVKNKEFKLTDIDRESIIEDITKIMNWLKSKNYEQIEDDEYEKVIKNIQKQYGVLILKGSLEADNVKAMEVSDNKEMTTVFGNEQDDADDDIKQVFEAIENNEFGYSGMSEPEKAELKELRQAVTDLCYSIFEILSSGNMKISDQHLNELRDYIDDALLWLHVHEKPNKIEYKMKIDEINQTCDKIINHYGDKDDDLFKVNEIVSANKTKRDELENLCYVLKLMIQDGAFPINKKYLISFDESISEIIKWISESDEQYKTELDKYYELCDEKINYVNCLSNDIYQKMQGINLDNKKDIFGDERILSGYHDNEDALVDDDEMGTDIIALVRDRQKNIIDEMINNDDNIINYIDSFDQPNDNQPNDNQPNDNQPNDN